MKQKPTIFTITTSVVFLALFTTASIFADSQTTGNKNILIQEDDLVITRQDALLMIEDMTWAQKQKLLKNEDKFQALLLQFLTLKKKEKAAIDKKLNSNALIKWKLKKQNAQILSSELVKDFRKGIKIPKSIEDIARDNYDAHPEKYIIDERVSVSHILLKIKKEASEEEKQKTLKQAHKIIAEIKNGLNFEKAARKYSEDKGSASNGGNINYFKHGQMVAPFEKAAFSMKEIGSISEPVLSKFGYHIIKLTGRIEASVKPFEDAKHDLVKTERNKYLQQKTDEFLTSFATNKNTTVYLSALQLLLKEEVSKLKNPFEKAN